MNGPASSFLVGMNLVPHEETLELQAQLIEEEVELYEVAPETLWFLAADRSIRPNAFQERFAALRERTGRPFVAHGVGWSVGSAETPAQQERDALWLDGIRATQRAFDFAWYTDHLGATVVDGLEMTLPLALPMTTAMAEHAGERLARLREHVPEVGLENTCAYFLLGEALDEPSFLERILDGPGRHLLLDLHNVHTMATNFGFDAADYVERLPLERVIEIHVSGGSAGDPAWLPGGDALRLDSHDEAVPEEVWRLLEGVLPRCPNLRAVVLERMEGTVEEKDVPVLRDELRRIRALRGRGVS